MKTTAGSSGARDLILTHVISVALTPLIPIPFADDLAAGAFRRRMVRKLAEIHHLSLSDAEVRALAGRSGPGMAGRLRRFVTYPIRKIFRKVFFWLEWKRSIDMVGLDYHRAALLDHAMSRGWCSPGSGYSTDAVARAIEHTLAAADLATFQRAVRGAMAGSKAAIVAGVELLTRRLAALGRSSPEAAASALDGLTGERSSPLATLRAQIDRIVDSLPVEHFSLLQARMERELTARPSTVRLDPVAS